MSVDSQEQDMRCTFRPTIGPNTRCTIQATFTWSGYQGLMFPAAYSFVVFLN